MTPKSDTSYYLIVVIISIQKNPCAKTESKIEMWETTWLVGMGSILHTQIADFFSRGNSRNQELFTFAEI